MLETDPTMSSHVSYNGGEQTAWVLSYVAGSAIGINTHLAVADQFGLAPVTDSSLHHQLMLMKMGRSANNKKSNFLATDALANLLTRHTIINVMEKWLPQEILAKISIQDVLAFRGESQTLRRAFFSETRQEVEKRIAGATSRQIEKVVSSTSDFITKQAGQYQNDMETLRDKLWPKLIGAFGSKTALAGLGATLGASMILSPAHMLITSIPTIVEPAKVILNWNAERRKLKRNASASVAYLSSIARKISR
jgi:hypothetical protein